MMPKDHKNITILEALDWTEKNCMFDDVRKRMRSRAVAYRLYEALKKAVGRIQELEQELKDVKISTTEST